MSSKKKRVSKRKASRRRSVGKASANARRCGLCGKTNRLMRTECCNQWICDDEDEYVMFSYARNSCSRNHRRYTLCASHFVEEHVGAWRTCDACRAAFETEIYVYYGTNEYNFEKLEDPPTFEPTRCKECNQIIRLAEDGYTMRGDKYICTDCYEVPF